MKLYFAPGACSLAPYRDARGGREPRPRAGQQSGKDQIQRRLLDHQRQGPSPVLEFDNGERLTEGPVIVQWIADQNPASGLVPPAGARALSGAGVAGFITSELHKTFGPIFRPTTPDAYKAISKENLGKRFDWLDKQLAGKQYLWATSSPSPTPTSTRCCAGPRIEMDLAKWPNLKAYVDRVGARRRCWRRSRRKADPKPSHGNGYGNIWQSLASPPCPARNNPPAAACGRKPAILAATGACQRRRKQHPCPGTAHSQVVAGGSVTANEAEGLSERRPDLFRSATALDRRRSAESGKLALIKSVSPRRSARKFSRLVPVRRSDPAGVRERVE